MLEDLMKIYEDISLEHDEAMINWWRCEDLKICVLIKLGVGNQGFTWRTQSLKICALNLDNLAL